MFWLDHSLTQPPFLLPLSKFFSGFSLIAFFWTFFLCPETKGKSLEGASFP